MPDKCPPIALNIVELFELRDYHHKQFSWINDLPAERQDQITMAGWPLRETGQTHLRRYREIDDIIQNTWPK